MPARFIKGDIFATVGIRAYTHGCNCAGAMGAGIAIEFERRWPRMFDDYAARCVDGRFGLGDVCVWSEGEHTIFSLGTQEHGARSRSCRRSRSRSPECSNSQRTWG